MIHTYHQRIERSGCERVVRSAQLLGNHISKLKSEHVNIHKRGVFVYVAVS